MYEELAKWLPGVAGESRSFDANGMWFKVLGSGGLETVSLGDGLFGSLVRPILGVNPPPDRTRPPLRPDVPCETQERPDLRSIPGAPAADRAHQPQLARGASARRPRPASTALAVLRRELRDAGRKLDVLDRDATLADIRRLASRNGLLPQLNRTLKEQRSR